MENTSEDATKDQLIADFNEVVTDAEALLQATANQGNEKLAALRARTEESLRIAKARMVEAEAALVAKTKATAQATDLYVHENPWAAVGIAASAGLLIGLMLHRRHPHQHGL